MKVAFFDVDGTIIRDNSMENIFIKYLIEKGKLKLLDMLRFGVFLMEDLCRFSISRMKGDKRYLRGKSHLEMKLLARECFENIIKAKISPWAIEYIEDHKKDGHKIVLFTGSVDILVEPLGDYLGADFTISTKLEIESGNYTGERLNLHPYGENKLKLLKEFCEQKHIDRLESYAYADRYSDVPFLSSVGRPTAVNPDRKLRKYAEQCNWKLIQF